MIDHNNFFIIAAVDELGGFSKNGQIPWHYPADLRWFKQQTENGVCLMGKTTYYDLLRRAKERQSRKLNIGNEPQNVNENTNLELLPNRRCFVVSNTLATQPDSVVGATPLRNIWDIEKHVDENTKIFLIGGERIFKEGIAFANTILLTVINKDYECDLFFPTKYLLNYFVEQHIYKLDNEPDLRFTVWRRKK